MARRFLARLGNYHRQHPATGQSGILFSKLPRLNQRIALNGALLVIPPSSPTLLPSSPFTHELFIPSTQFCTGVRLSESQSEIQVQIIIAFIAQRALKTRAARYSQIKAARKVASFPFKSLALRILASCNKMLHDSF